MLPYLNRRYWKLLKIFLACVIVVQFYLVYHVLRPDVAVERFPPQKLPFYECPFNVSTLDQFAIPKPRNNLTDSKILLLLDSVYSRHGKLLIQTLDALRFPYKAEAMAKNLPVLTTAFRGRYSIVVIENYYKYLNMPKWNRQLLDKYCKDYKVPIIGFITTKPNTSYPRVKLKGSGVYLWLNQTVSSLHLEEVNLNRIGKAGATLRNIAVKEFVLFEPHKGFQEVISAEDELGRKRAAVIHDLGQYDLVERVLYGYNVTNWIIKMNFIDSLWYYSGGTIGWSLDRFIEVDIDDIFVGARGTRLIEDDVREIIRFQDRLRSSISNFTFMLGYSGSYFRNGDDNEDGGDEALIESASSFVWFPHMWRHNHAHEHNGTYLEATMAQNKLFAENYKLPVLYPYAIAPQHDGIFPVHEELYDAWLKIWNVRTSATEEYPHFKPASSRRGFIHKNIMVLPRQTCGLYTHTQFFHNYPDGFSKLVSLIQGGDLFSTILLNPISIFMTHQQNYAHDRLAIYTFENLVRFIECWTNLKLRWQDPISSAEMYFQLFPMERTPIWTNPCVDPRHRAIVPPSLNCSNFTLPSVLIVGPQKTGTTALASFLSLHPNTSTNAPIPGSWEELQFFGGANYHQGIEWYSKQFSPANVIFEKSATYFDNPYAAKEIASLVPDAHIVVILFDPAKRAYSWYQHLLAHNDTDAIEAGSMEAILNATKPNLMKIRQRCVSGGRYTHHLDRWYELFPSSHVHLIDGEILREDPITVVRELSSSLGLPPFDYEHAMRYSPSKGFYCQIVEGKTKCLGRSKGRKYPPPSISLTNKLNQLFAPDNSALFKFLVKNKYPVPNWLRNVVESLDV